MNKLEDDDIPDGVKKLAHKLRADPVSDVDDEQTWKQNLVLVWHIYGSDGIAYTMAQWTDVDLTDEGPETGLRGVLWFRGTISAKEVVDWITHELD